MLHKNSIDADFMKKVDASAFPAYLLPLLSTPAECVQQAIDIQLVIDKGGNILAEILGWQKVLLWAREMAYYFMGNPSTKNVRMSIMAFNNRVHPNFAFTDDLNQVLLDLDYTDANCLDDICQARDSETRSNIAEALKQALRNFQQLAKADGHERTSLRSGHSNTAKRRKVLVYVGTGHYRSRNEEFNATCGYFPKRYLDCADDELKCSFDDEFHISTNVSCSIDMANQLKKEGVELFAFKTGRNWLAKPENYAWLKSTFVTDSAANYQEIESYTALRNSQGREDVFGRVACADPHRLPTIGPLRDCICTCRLDLYRNKDIQGENNSTCFAEAQAQAQMHAQDLPEVSTTATITLPPTMTEIKPIKLNRLGLTL